ncbi:FAD-dependent oxidoreductase [soil metagenome]
MRDAQAANVESAGDRLVSRRAVLKTAGYGALALSGIGALSTPAQAAGSTARIAIVGAGIAGLNAALKLQDLGLASAVYEASDRIGGRIYTVSDAVAPGITSEIGGEFIDSDHREMIHLAQRFGLGLLDLKTKLNETFYFGGQFRSHQEIVEAFRPLARRIAADQEAVEYESYQSYNSRAAKLDLTPLTVYLREIGAKGWLYELLDVAYATEYGRETWQQSALNLVFLIGTDLQDGFKEFGESDQRFKIDGGNAQLVTRMAAALQQPVQTGTALAAIDRTGLAYRLTFHQPNAQSLVVEADYVLLTLPLTLLREVDLRVPLSRPQQKAISKVPYGTNAKLILGFDRRYWYDQGASGLFFSDLPIQSGWDSSQGQPGQAGALTLFLGGHRGLALAEGTAHTQRDRALPSVDAVFSGARNHATGKVLRFNWPTYHWTKGSYTCFGPGDYIAYGGVFDKPAEQVYFAGEHCSIDYQGYMEGGAVTGHKAAKAIARALKVL